MSIYVDARMICSSGIGTYLKNILPCLQSLPITLILRENDVERFSWLNKFKKITCNFPIYSIQEQIYYKRTLPKCDLFWSPHINVPYFSIKARKRLVTIHDVYHLAFFSALHWKEKLYAKAIYKKAVSLSDAIISDSEFSKAELMKYTNVQKDKVHVIYCGVDRRLFTRKNIAEVKKTVTRRHLKFPYFLFVGNIKPHKNLNNLIQAFQKVSQRYHLIIIGQAEGLLNSFNIRSILDDSLKRRVHIFSDVQDEELPIFYQLAIATVFPSIYEGFGLPLLEAMACGSPILASTAASIPEIGKDAAYYFDPFNTIDIAEAMNKIAQDEILRNSFIQKGYQRVEQFNWGISAGKHKKMINKLLL